MDNIYKINSLIHFSLFPDMPETGAPEPQLPGLPGVLLGKDSASFVQMKEFHYKSACSAAWGLPRINTGVLLLTYKQHISLHH